MAKIYHASINRNLLQFRSHVGELHSSCSTIGVNIGELYHKINSHCNDDEKRRGPISNATWRELEEDVMNVRKLLAEAEREIQKIFLDLHHRSYLPNPELGEKQAALECGEGTDNQ